MPSAAREGLSGHDFAEATADAGEGAWAADPEREAQRILRTGSVLDDPLDLSRFTHNRDARLVRSFDHSIAVEEEAFAGVDGETGCARLCHGFDGLHADHGNVKPHVLVGLGNFDHGEMAAENSIVLVSCRGECIV